MSNVVNLVFVQADCLDEVYLDFVTGCNTANQVSARNTHVLCNSKDGRNVVTGVRILSSQEGVVVVEFTNSNTVCPGSPLWRDAKILWFSE